MDRFRNVYVASIGDNTVRRFSASGRDLGHLCQGGSESAHEFGPSIRAAIYSWSNNGDNSIVKFSAAGKPLGLVVFALGQRLP
ncbi:MAG: hypothetical protein WDO74_32715 [Pseudomonadota bacterium]